MAFTKASVFGAIDPVDHREFLPVNDAISREVLVGLNQLPNDELEFLALDLWLGRSETAKTQQDIAEAANCSSGHASRRIADFKNRVKRYMDQNI